MTLAERTAAAAGVVAATQARLPPALRKPAASIAVRYEAAPDAGLIADGFEPDILGLFSGDAHGVVSDHPLPPVILLYLDSLWEFSEEDPDIFREEVRLTYLHELGHYFGWDEDDIADRGLD